MRVKRGSPAGLTSSIRTAPFRTVTSPLSVMPFALLLTFIIEIPCDLAPKRVSNPNLISGFISHEPANRQIGSVINKSVRCMIIFVCGLCFSISVQK